MWLRTAPGLTERARTWWLLLSSRAAGSVPGAFTHRAPEVQGSLPDPRSPRQVPSPALLSLGLFLRPTSRPCVPPTPCNFSSDGKGKEAYFRPPGETSLAERQALGCFWRWPSRDRLTLAPQPTQTVSLFPGAIESPL